jgi:glycerophosphoryl diester phosphodiesterase
VNKHIAIVAHRGGSRGVYTENSLDAFYFAVKNDIKCIEMDIRLNHFNGTFYLEHDLIHSPKVRKNFFENIINFVPEDVTIFCELKTYTLNRMFYAKTFLEVVQKYNLEDKIVVMSFNPFVLSQLRKIGYKGRIGMLMGTNLMWLLFKNYMVKKIKPEYLMLSRRVINKNKINFAHSKGYKLFIHVANKEKDWDLATRLKLDGIITDYPLLLRDYLNA